MFTKYQCLRRFRLFVITRCACRYWTFWIIYLFISTYSLTFTNRIHIQEFWHACLWAKLKKACTTSYPYLPSSNTGFLRNICIVYSKNRFVEKSNNFENFTFVHTEGETMRNTRSSGADLDLNECRSLVLILIWSIFWKYYFSNSFCHHFI